MKLLGVAPSVPGASTFTKQSITWVLGWHSSAIENLLRPSLWGVGLGGQRFLESQPHVHVTSLCSRDEKLKAGIIFHINLPGQCSEARSSALHTVGSGIWSLSYQCPAAGSGAVVQMENSYFQQLYLCSFPLRICARILSSWDLTQTPCPRSVGLSGEGVTKAHSDEVQVVL